MLFIVDNIVLSTKNWNQLSISTANTQNNDELLLDQRTDFPSQPTPKSLRETYSLLRSTAQSINRSRSQYISQLRKRDLVIEDLHNEISDYAQKANLDIQEKAHLLGIMAKYSEIFESMEQAGDDLVNGAETYRNGIGQYFGGRPFADLIKELFTGS